MKNFLLPFWLRPQKKIEDDGAPRYADMQVRALAAAIDLTLLFALFRRAFEALSQRIYASLDPELLSKIQTATDPETLLRLLLQSHFLFLWTVNSAIQVLLIGIVYVGCQCFERTTPGKWLMGLRIVDARTLEQPARWRYLLRFLAYFPAIFPLMLGIIWVSVHKQRRGWHDIIAGTAVIHTRPRDWAWVQLKRGVRWVISKIRSG